MMETEKKKALLELIKECEDAGYLKQISYTALVMANAVAAIKKPIHWQMNRLIQKKVPHTMLKESNVI